MTLEEEYSQLLVRLASDALEWCKVFLKGGSSPAWTDGRELNYLRKKIVNDVEELEKKGFSAEYFLELPPEMDVTYMKNCEDIEKKAKAALKQYLQDENYCYLVEHLEFLGNIQKSCMKNPPDEALDPITELEKAIQEKDYLTMRKYSQGEYSIKKQLKKIKACREEAEIEIDDMNPF